MRGPRSPRPRRISPPRTEAARLKQLAARQAVSRQDDENATTTLAQGEADMAANKATLEADRISLD